MEWKLKVYPVLAVVLGLLLLSSVNILVSQPQTPNRQSFGNQSKEDSSGLVPSAIQGDSQSFEATQSSEEAVISFEMLAIGLVVALGVYFVARHRFI